MHILCIFQILLIFLFIVENEITAVLKDVKMKNAALLRKNVNFSFVFPTEIYLLIQGVF